MIKNNKVYIALAIIMFFGFGVILVAVLLNEGKPFWLDTAIQNAVLAARNDVSSIFFKVVTFFSDPVFIVGLLLVFLIIPRTRKRYGVPLAITEAAAFAGYSLIKELVARARPEEFLRLAEETSYSFPSGHAVSSFVVYGLMIYLIYNNYTGKKRTRDIMIVLLFIYILLIPISRVYLCVHWPTDIIAGWFYGATVLIISIGILENRRKKKVEKERLGLDDDDVDDVIEIENRK